MTTTRFSEPARLSTPSKPPANHCLNENRWSATWFWPLLSKVFLMKGVYTPYSKMAAILVFFCLIANSSTCLHLHVAALGKVLLTYGTSLFRDFTPSRSLLLETTHSQRTATTPGTSSPSLLEYCVGSLTSRRELVNRKDICETGSMVYSPYPRRLESLTICGCNYKGSTFSSVISPQICP